jgi:hypothetical protein
VGRLEWGGWSGAAGVERLDPFGTVRSEAAHHPAKGDVAVADDASGQVLLHLGIELTNEGVSSHPADENQQPKRATAATSAELDARSSSLTSYRFSTTPVKINEPSMSPPPAVEGSASLPPQPAPSSTDASTKDQLARRLCVMARQRSRAVDPLDVKKVHAALARWAKLLSSDVNWRSVLVAQVHGLHHVQ